MRFNIPRLPRNEEGIASTGFADDMAQADLPRVLAAVDAALYVAKASGWNLSVIGGDLDALKTAPKVAFDCDTAARSR